MMVILLVYHAGMFKLQISSIFNFDRAHQSWICGVLGVKWKTGNSNLKRDQLLSQAPEQKSSENTSHGNANENNATDLLVLI